MNGDFRKLSNSELESRIQSTVLHERRITIEVLHLLREVEKRELFARLGFSSLLDYCVRNLKYSEAAAMRRITAMRALRELPELEQKIETGKLSLSVLALTESSLKQNAKRENRKVTVHERRETFQAVEGLSKRHAERTLVEKFDLAPPKIESAERPLSDGGTRIVIELTPEEMACIEELRRLSSEPRTAKEMIMSLVRSEAARKKRQLGEAPLLRKHSGEGKRVVGGAAKTSVSGAPRGAVKIVISGEIGDEIRDAVGGAVFKRELVSKTGSAGASTALSTASSTSTFAGGGIKLGNSKRVSKTTRHALPTAVKRAVWIRAHAQCEHRNAFGERCTEKHGLEFDHIVPKSFAKNRAVVSKALGGVDGPQNLRLLCRAHHRLVTTDLFGKTKMQQFRKSLKDLPRLNSLVFATSQFVSRE